MILSKEILKFESFQLEIIVRDFTCPERILAEMMQAEGMSKASFNIGGPAVIPLSLKDDLIRSVATNL
jgi:hypothetical protein